jgi:hypothetical protein
VRIGLAGAGLADAGAFLARLTRLDPAALVRLRPVGAAIPPPAFASRPTGPPPASASGPTRTELWARLPWEALVTRTVPGGPAQDTTVRAADLLAELARDGTALPPRRDEQWRWPLPPARVEVLERVPVDAVREIGAAAEGTVRAAARGGVGGRAVGDRVVRDALLDHVAISVTPQLPGEPVEVPQRLVQAVIRMGFLGRPGTGDTVRVLRAGGSWTGLAAEYGTGWLRPAAGLTVRQRG